MGAAPITSTFLLDLGYAYSGFQVQFFTLSYTFSESSVGVSPAVYLAHVRAFGHSSSKKYAATSHSALERGYDFNFEFAEERVREVWRFLTEKIGRIR